MAKNIFTSVFIDTTLKNLRRIVSSFSSNSGSVSVVSPIRIESQLSLWKKTIPNVSPYYAVKCNPEPLLLQTLITNEVNFDCASLREVKEVINCGHPYDQLPPDILYAHPMKSHKDIHSLGQMNIKTTVVDSLEECEKLTESKWSGSAFIRLAVDDKDSKMPFSSKFGATERELIEIAKYSNIPITGVSFHVGSGCENPLQYKRAIEFASGTGFDILRNYLHLPKVVDIGGGFSSDPVFFKNTMKLIKNDLDTIPKNRTIIAEPGRFIAQPSQDLFVKVIAKKPGQDGGWRYVIDESLYGHFSCIPFDHQKPAWFRVPESEYDKGRDVNYSIIFGRTCDSLDVIAKGLMEDLEVGDWLYFPLMGAYTSATASEFNGFPKPEVKKDEGLLPTTEDAWSMVKEFHRVNSTLQYSNTLVPIL
jgi:ornithine decarboxylase